MIVEPSLQRRIQRYGWDKASVFYESAWYQQLKPAQDKLMEMAVLNEGERVLDIACGTGLVSFPVANKVGLNGYVLGTDISEKMIEVSKARAIENEIKNVRFERMDAEELDLEDESFDVVVCALGLMYVPDPVKSLKEMHRVLKQGGRAAAAVWGRRQKCGWAEIFEIVDRRVRSEVCPMFFHLGNFEILMRSFDVSGFSNCSEERISTTLLYSSDEEACMAAFDGGPVALAFHKFSSKEKAEAHKEYLQSIEPYRKESGFEIPGEFVVAVGYK
jgi:ubiquinone/menaquinone biosynthesis C-methylase UbiE